MNIKELHDRVIAHLGSDGNFIICTYRKEKFLVSKVYMLTHESVESVVFANYNSQEMLRICESLDTITNYGNRIKYSFGGGALDYGEIIFVTEV